MKKKAVVIQVDPAFYKYLEAADFEVIEAENCIIGIRKIIQYNPEVVVTLVDVPGLNAISMTGILRILQIQPPIFFVSKDSKYRKITKHFPNALGFLLDSQVDELGYMLEISLGKYTPPSPRYSYSFREHEWSDFMVPSERKRILLVDDSEEIRKLCLLRLDQTDEYELFSAGDGLEGLLKAMFLKPDLILTDILMPTLNGFAMSQIFFILDKPFPIVFLTAKEDEQTKHKARNIDGVIGYLNKDILKNKELFLNAIQNHIKMARTLRESLKATYELGAMETLLKPGKDKGILSYTPLKQKYTPSSEDQSRLFDQHSKGIGGLFKK